MIQLHGKGVHRRPYALKPGYISDKAVRNEWFSQEEVVDAREKIRLTRQQLARRSTSSEVASSQEVRRRRIQERSRRKKMKEWSMLS